MVDTTTAASVIDGIAANTLNYALLLAAIGTLSMAFIEVLKSVFSLRRVFHRKQVTEWLTDHSTQHELLILAAGGAHNADVLYDQATERMMGQIQAAANLALEYPARYPNAYKFFTQDDLEIKTLQGVAGLSDSKVWASFALQAEQAKGVSENPEEGDSRSAQQARVRLGNLIARRLDMFQNRTQFRWAYYNQFASIMIGAGLSAYVLIASQKGGDVDSNNMLTIFALSFLAGMLAPFAKDVVSAISGLRSKA